MGLEGPGYRVQGVGESEGWLSAASASVLWPMESISHRVVAPPLDKASSNALPPWAELALSVIRHALEDAFQGDYDALQWLISEGRVWLQALGLSPWVVDGWGAELHL